MADLRPVSGPLAAPSPARPLPAARAQAIAAAQRAFFDQALNAAPAAPPPRPAPAAMAAGSPAPQVTRLAFDAAAPAPERPLRPGSLLDIKV